MKKASKQKLRQTRRGLVLHWAVLALAQVLHMATNSAIFDIVRGVCLLTFLISLGRFYALKHNFFHNNAYRFLKKHQTQSCAYLAAKPAGEIQGIVIHSTDVHNPFLKRFVEYPAELGYNPEKNHWNAKTNRKMPHGFIGYDKKGSVIVVNTIPYSHSCFACGNGENGSYDGSPNTHIQITVCETQKDDAEYFDKAVLGAAVQYCADLCREFSLSAETIVSDKEAFENGYAETYTSFEDWLLSNKIDMDMFRNAVDVQLRETI